jgi:hypothetical protein
MQPVGQGALQRLGALQAQCGVHPLLVQRQVGGRIQHPATCLAELLPGGQAVLGVAHQSSSVSIRSIMNSASSCVIGSSPIFSTKKK